MDGKILIQKRTTSRVKGQQQEEWSDYYRPFAEEKDLSTLQQFKAMEIDLEETAVFKVRNCKLIEAMRTHLKEYRVKWRDDDYTVFAASIIDKKQYVLLKCNRVS